MSNRQIKTHAVWRVRTEGRLEMGYRAAPQVAEFAAGPTRRVEGVLDLDQVWVVAVQDVVEATRDLCRATNRTRGTADPELVRPRHADQNDSRNTHGQRILSYELKSAPLETPVFPVTDAAVRLALVELAATAFRALGARDYGRIDIRMSSDGVPHFLEANLIPCLIRGSGNFPKACLMNQGMDYEAMILHIVRLGFAYAVRSDFIKENLISAPRSLITTVA